MQFCAFAFVPNLSKLPTAVLVFSHVVTCNAVTGSYDALNISETVHLIAVKYGKGAGAPALRDSSHALEVHPALCAASCMQCTSEVV